MIGAIPNPTKTITIDFPIGRVKDAVRNIDKTLKFTHFRESNEMFNTYTFARSEFLSMGALININLNELGETKTQINIEISRQLGAFDQWVEVQKANEHIAGVINAIAHILQNGVSVMPKQDEGAASTFFKLIGYSVLAIIILGIISGMLK